MTSVEGKDLELFCKTAKTIFRKGHLTLDALLRFVGSRDHRRDKKILEKLFKLGLLVKHRSDTYELSSIGRMFAMDRCEWFKERK
ncbi:MAG: hypothetical protein QF486_05755 [Candidatus Woesearchaeota archaeon]|jgi:hypothetical protein|nr:hypothetical protein [Candidatus Woesearchaeota archaeon]MDP7467801.1 hypothetical protein [Candidatus Woesearchaeota archaeon]MDP7647947.1 hypothetical protein [Candidatus Woesearchaeota archaeon]|tara:strand:+ start:1055 stop:1309 length:255 start_codon:yes stop_codon:yes gene_type:complete